MVPDLSLVSDTPIRSSEINDNSKFYEMMKMNQEIMRQNQERFKTIYPLHRQTAPIKTSPPKIRVQKVNFQDPKVYRHPVDVAEKNINVLFNSQRCNSKPLKPVQVNNKSQKQYKQSNEEIYEMIKQQDEQLQKISEQLQEVLRIHKIKEERSPVAPKPVGKRSVMTMTSLVLSHSENITTNNALKPSPSYKSKPKQSTTSKELKNVRLPTICESPSNHSIEIDTNHLDFSESPCRNSNNCHSNSSIEVCRNGHVNNDVFYNQIIDNINSMLNNNIDQSDDDSERRSSCSVTPPRFNSPKIAHNHHQQQDYQVHLHSEQTLYIKKLASKYLAEEQKTKTKFKQKELFVQQNDFADLKCYGLPKNASIATKNYLEKYGLTFNHMPPKVLNQRLNHNPIINNDDHHHRRRRRRLHNPHHQDLDFDQFHHLQNHHNKYHPEKNRILDIEALKKQPKLT